MTDQTDSFEDIRIIDPIDGHRLAKDWSTSDAKAALFREITTPGVAPHASRRRIPRRFLVLAAGLAAAGMGIAVSGILPGGDAPAFAVRQLPNGVIEIENVADIHDPRGLEAELREFGIDAEIITEPASPSRVGHAEAHAEGLGDRKDAVTATLPGLRFGKDGSKNVFRWRIDPKEFRDRITITLYVAAQPGEPYVHSLDAFHPGEALDGLHCTVGEPVRASEVASRLSDLGITGQWFVLTGFQSHTDGGTYSTRPSRGVPQGVIMTSQPIDDQMVRFEVLPDGLTAPRWMETTYSDVPCTEDPA